MVSDRRRCPTLQPSGLNKSVNSFRGNKRLGCVQAGGMWFGLFRLIDFSDALGPSKWLESGYYSGCEAARPSLFWLGRIGCRSGGYKWKDGIGNLQFACTAQKLCLGQKLTRAVQVWMNFFNSASLSMQHLRSASASSRGRRALRTWSTCNGGPKTNGAGSAGKRTSEPYGVKMAGR